MKLKVKIMWAIMFSILLTMLAIIIHKDRIHDYTVSWQKVPVINLDPNNPAHHKKIKEIESILSDTNIQWQEAERVEGLITDEDIGWKEEKIIKLK